MIAFIKIVLLSVLAAVSYGIVMDQITARVCVEYFLIGHPVIVETESPTLLALLWGVIATWWMGVLLGVPLALATRVGRWPKCSPGALVRPILILLGIMAVTSLLAGLVGYSLSKNAKVSLVDPLWSAVALDRHDVFLADAFAHLASYVVGTLGGIVLIGFTLVMRYWEAKEDEDRDAPDRPVIVDMEIVQDGTE